MYWLITYTQNSASGNSITANTVTSSHPADWLYRRVKEYPGTGVVLNFAIEIDSSQHRDLQYEVG